MRATQMRRDIADGARHVGGAVQVQARRFLIPPRRRCAPPPFYRFCSSMAGRRLHATMSRRCRNAADRQRRRLPKSRYATPAMMPRYAAITAQSSALTAHAHVDFR